MNKLNIGCGLVKKEGYINLDKSPEVKPDIVFNIEQGIPFPKDYFDEIYSSHVLEHIRPDYWDFVMKEIARVAKSDCLLHLFLPYDNIKSRTDIAHYRTFTWWSFLPLEIGVQDGRYNYFSNLRLKRISVLPNKFMRFIYTLFPWIINEIELKYLIKKNY